MTGRGIARLRHALPALPGLPETHVPSDLKAKAGRFSLDSLPTLEGDYETAADWYDRVAPDVSIVILNWNRADITLLCLRHLWQRTRGFRYEIIVVDNGSRADQLAELRQGAVLARIVSIGTNRYFGEANNIGCEAAKGRYVCFLNNDVFVHEGWLEPLIEQLEADPAVGAIGPRFIYPDGRLQEAGAVVDPDGSVTQLGKGEAADDPRFGVMRTVHYVSAACLALRRQQFLRVLGFDLTWDPAYYEDVDLCLKLGLLGLRTVYCPASTVTHIENATSSDTSHGLRLGTVVSLNRSKFVARWGEHLLSGGNAPDLIPEAPAEDGPDAALPRVAIFTMFNITAGGGERYFLGLAEALRDVARVTLVTPMPFSRTRILTMGRIFGLRLDRLELLALNAPPPTKAFDVGFVLANSILPPIGRLARTNVFICQFPFPLENEEDEVLWRPLWPDYSLILVYSEFVRHHVETSMERMALPARPVEVLAPPVPMMRAGERKRAQILHVGRFFSGGHCKRQDILIAAFRSLVESGVEAELHLAGSTHPESEHRAYYDDLLRLASGLPVRFHADCGAETLATLYADSLVYWHATGFGHDVVAEPHKAEHFGISVVEAMSAGCIPVVFSAGGPADIVADGVSGFLFSTVEQLSERTRALLHDTSPERLAALADAAAKAAHAFDEAVFRQRARDLVARLLASERQDDVE